MRVCLQCLGLEKTVESATGQAIDEGVVEISAMSRPTQLALASCVHFDFGGTGLAWAIWIKFFAAHNAVLKVLIGRREVRAEGRPCVVSAQATWMRAHDDLMMVGGGREGVQLHGAACGHVSKAQLPPSTPRARCIQGPRPVGDARARRGGEKIFSPASLSCSAPDLVLVATTFSSSAYCSFCCLARRADWGCGSDRPRGRMGPGTTWTHGQGAVLAAEFLGALITPRRNLRSAVGPLIFLQRHTTDPSLMEPPRRVSRSAPGYLNPPLPPSLPRPSAFACESQTATAILRQSPVRQPGS
ncbi:hypothetical protein FA95DRAFT_1161686 [Auriscalpium vulgare]|uniref:Uncharacterized protein n=1 Tax=Auriscalpium vulgare TaxID=40419 RepID=A0ACB8S8Q6_9AGAM|nr:hypothetical protein FA95DRAFT_1161686 [Auriscalpium vulgare]